MKRHLLLAFMLIALAIFSSGLGPSLAQSGSLSLQSPLSTAITYQGRLTEAGRPANGAYDFDFTLFDQPEEGAPVGPSVMLNAVPVAQGLFTVQLDFGDGVFEGRALFLEIAVRPAGSAEPYTVLAPRQALTAAPYALYARGAPWAGLRDIPAGFADGIDNDTTYRAGVGLELAENRFALLMGYRLPQTCGRGQVTKWNGQAWECGDDDADAGPYWRLAGNTGTSPATHFLGTTDDVSLTLAVSGTAALRLFPDAISPNLIGGFAGNAAVAGVHGASIGGGGQEGKPNTVAGDFGVIGGGVGNAARGVNSSIVGGSGNTAGGAFASIGGGANHRADGSYAVIAGGQDHNAPGSHSAIGGGLRNRAASTGATIAGGRNNQANGNTDTVGGGESNSANGPQAVVAGGLGNSAAGPQTAIGGGALNRAGAEAAAIAGGRENQARQSYATVGGGQLNIVDGEYAVIAGGRENGISQGFAAIGGGAQNAAQASYAAIAGGAQNTVAGYYGAVGGGYAHRILGHYGFIGGGYNNEVTGEYGVIAGGGRASPQDPASANRVTDDYGAIGGGGDNQAGNKNANTGDAPYATVSGGKSNWATATWAAIGGGAGNQATGPAAYIGGGLSNYADNEQTVVGGGANNRATAGRATVAGGKGNEASGSLAAIGGGESNLARHLFTAIAGGRSNLADAPYATVAGGFGNQALAEFSVIAGGGRTSAEDYRTGNLVTDRFGAIGGGGDNQAGNANSSPHDAEYAVVAGGQSNTAGNKYAAVGGGWNNSATGDGAVVAGGVGNSAPALHAAVAGGNTNAALGERSAIGGGSSNRTEGNHATVPGGYANVAKGDYSFAAGYRASANNQGCFVWSDNATITPVTCSNDFRWVARASGGVYFYTNAGMTSGVRVSAGGGGWESLSDRNSKENFAPANGRAILEQLARLPLATWNYTTQDPSIRHIGPVAQDFYALFGVGEDDTHISTIDADGVALASIQGLHQIVQEQETKIQLLQDENARLAERLAAQEQRLSDFEARLARLERGGVTTSWPKRALLSGLLVAGAFALPRLRRAWRR